MVSQYIIFAMSYRLLNVLIIWMTSSVLTHGSQQSQKVMTSKSRAIRPARVPVHSYATTAAAAAAAGMARVSMGMERSRVTHGLDVRQSADETTVTAGHISHQSARRMRAVSLDASEWKSVSD